ncbi:hypothetical protein SUGI_0770790 [Cryptomeria japonica]|nr:hypothetical protein SUGI_0770790 [Cryptomeria japonica]
MDDRPHPVPKLSHRFGDVSGGNFFFGIARKCPQAEPSLSSDALGARTMAKTPGDASSYFPAYNFLEAAQTSSPFSSQTTYLTPDSPRFLLAAFLKFNFIQLACEGGHLILDSNL